MRSLIFLGAVLVGSPLWCQESPSRQGPYLGVAVGLFDIDTGRLNDAAPMQKLYGGFRFNERWAIEGSYAETSNLESQQSFGFPVAAEFEIIEVRGLAHVGQFFAGIGYWDLESSASGLPLFIRDDSGLSSVVGGEWSFEDRWGLRLEYESFDAAGAIEISTLSFGAHFRFGRR